MIGVRPCRWMQLGTLIALACLELARAASAQGQLAPFGVLNKTGRGVDAQLVAEVDRALRLELSQSFGIDDPISPPTDYEEILLNIGCEGNERECLAAAAETIQVEQVVLRDLSTDEAGRSVLRLVRFKPSSDSEPAHAETVLVAGSTAAPAREVPRLVRAIFGVEETPDAPELVVPSPPPPPPKAPVASLPQSVPLVDSPDHAATERDESRGSVGPLTWTMLISGTAVLASGVALGLSAQRSYEDFQNEPVVVERDAQRAKSDFDDLETRGTIANVLMPAGGALLGVGIVLLILDLSAADDSTHGTARVSVSQLTHGAALTFSTPFGER